MAKNSTARIQDILGILNTICPPQLAEEWDNVGLQVGDPNAVVSRVAIALDPTAEALADAIAAGAELLICHHPLIFKPLRQVTPTDGTGKVVTQAVREGVAIVAAHTNLDRASGGLNDWLAARVGLEKTEPLEAPEGMLFKLAVFVPADHEQAVAEAIFAAGGGHVGAYDQCSFRANGTGTFRPGEETTPFIGEQGKSEAVAETRFETIVTKESLGRVVSRMLKAHPYEEVAYDLYPLLNSRKDVGLGRIGRLSEKKTLGEYAGEIKQALSADHVRIVGGAADVISKVAVCGGSGASLLSAAARQGADVLVTGDIKYHEALIAESLGISLIDAGHYATEQIMVEELTQTLRRCVEHKGFEIEVLPLQSGQDPFSII